MSQRKGGSLRRSSRRPAAANAGARVTGRWWARQKPICAIAGRADGFAASFAHLTQADCIWESEPDWYERSPIAKRPFGSHCGTPLGFQFREGSVNMDLTVGNFDDSGDFVPKHHFGIEALHEAWIGMSAHPRFRTTDYEPLVQKWKDAIGSVPE